MSLGLRHLKNKYVANKKALTLLREGLIRFKLNTYFLAAKRAAASSQFTTSQNALM
jgi:hypothetical protein